MLVLSAIQKRKGDDQLKRLANHVQLSLSWTSDWPIHPRHHHAPPAETKGRESEEVMTTTEWLKDQCNRYANGQCSTRACLVRGNAVGLDGKPDYSKATCHAHECLSDRREFEAEVERLKSDVTALRNRIMDDEAANDDGAVVTESE